MKLTEKNGYTIISDFDSAEEFADIKAETAVLVFMPEKSFCADADFMRNMPYITILASKSLQDYSPEMLMMFDVRLAKEPYFMRNSAEYLGIYRKICGKNSAYRYENTPETDNFQTDLVREISGDVAEAVDEYLTNILKDKSDYQVKAIASCLITARKGSADDVLDEESKQFYRLIRKKAEV
ncbi:MAG: hypothetical protein K2K91_07105 [Ruminococcus sp.]|nr:hypothetical protein [Ruminococcus sp.]